MIAHEKERFEMAEKRERSLSNTMIFIRLVLYLCQSCVVDPSLSLSLFAQRMNSIVAMKPVLLAICVYKKEQKPHDK